MRKQGFTLLEILVTATIIAVITAIGVVSYASINVRSRDAKRKSDLEQVRSALEMYRTDNGSYPGSSTSFSQLSTDLSVLVPTYMPSIPMDPKSTSSAPVPYYYRVLGSGPTYTSYCVCTTVESPGNVSNTCGVTDPSKCNYYLKNP